jgi:uncharacterized protein YqgC (DUF456 family)
LVHYFVAILVSIAAPLFWVATLLGFPGNWGLVGLALLLVWLFPSTAWVGMEVPALVGVISLAAVGEVVEFFAGAAGVNQLGGSKRGTALAVVGSIVGAVAGMFVGIPVPIIGSLIGAVVFGGLGAFGGAVVGERWAGKEWDLSIRIGWGALWGKLLGTLLKTICGTACLVLLLYAVWV